MRVISVSQGTPEWAQARADHFCASEAPAMMGVSRFMSRSELLRQKHTGIAPDVDAATQARFDAGHAAEAATRPLVEALIDDELYPAVATDDEGWLLASFDGINMAGDTGFESKLWNEELAAAVRAGELPPAYYWQLEQQILVGGLERVIFACSDGTPEKFVHMEYRAVPGRAEQLIAGWKQFAADLSTYTPPEVIPAAVADTIKALPALTVQVEGKVVSSNLAVFSEAAKKFIANIKTDLQTDVDFANAEQTVKFCKEGEERLETVKAQALAQTASIDELFRTVDEISGQLRSKRLELDKLVKARKESIKVEIVQAAKTAYTAHIEALKADTGGPWILLAPPDFAGKIKGLRTVTSLRDAVDTELARAKIEANESAMKIKAALSALAEESKGYEHLFADRLSFVSKTPEDVRALARARITEHKAAEERRAAELAEQAREKIRQEEAAKLQKEADARAAREREAAEAQARQTAKPEIADMPAVAVTPPHAVAAKPTATVTAIPAKAKRPTDDEIIDALSLHYRVHESKVLEWLLDMDLDAAGKRLAAQFA